MPDRQRTMSMPSLALCGKPLDRVPSLPHP